MQRSATDTAVIILAVSIGVAVFALAGAAAYAISVDHITLTDATVSLISTLLGAVVGALSTYMGLGRERDSPTPDEVPSPPDAPQVPPVTS